MLDKEELEKRASVILEGDNYVSMLGVQLVSIEEDKICGRMPYRGEVLNLFNSIHGGALYSFADIIAGTLACSCGYFCSTVNGNMNYLRGAMNTEYVYCNASITRRGKNLTVEYYTITDDDGNVLDDGTFTFYKTAKPLE